MTNDPLSAQAFGDTLIARTWMRQVARFRAITRPESFPAAKIP